MSTSFTRGENPLRADKLNQAFSERVSRNGDTMTGMLKLWRDPIDPFDAATKQYIDRNSIPPIALGDTPPNSPPSGMLWFDSVSLQLYVRYADPNSVQWVPATNIAALSGDMPFLPLSGGTVSGVTTFSAGLSSPRINSDLDGALLFMGMGSTADFTKNWLFGNIYWYGGPITAGDTLAGNEVAANKLLFVDAAIINVADAHGFFVQSAIPGNTDAANTATRSAMHNKMAVTGQIGATPTIGPSIVPANFASHLSIVYANATQGGVGGWTAGNNPGTGYFRGSLFGGNDIAWLASGASNYWMVVGREVDVQILGTSNVYQRIGILENCAQSTSQAAGDDCGLMFVVQFQDPHNHKNGIQFGASTAFFQATDSLIKAVPVLYPTLTTPTYNNGVNFASVNFSGNAFSSPGFAVNGGGRVTSSGVAFGSVNASSGTDLSHHIDLYGGSFGFSVTPGNVLNHVTGGGGTHIFIVGSSPAVYITNNGLSGALGQDGIVGSATVADLRVNGNAGFNNTAPITKRTGYGAPTGTATRSTFLTSSVTLPVLAEHVKALIDDLTSYGLIGP